MNFPSAPPATADTIFIESEISTTVGYSSDLFDKESFTYPIIDIV